MLSVLWVFIKARIKGEYEYRTAFWIDMFSFILGYGSQAALMALMVTAFDTINGWKPAEVVLLYAYTLASYTLANTFFAGVMWGLSSRVKTGDFDQSLTKPFNPLIYEIISNFSEYYFLHFFMAIAMIVLGYFQTRQIITFTQVIVLVCAIIGGALIQGGVLILFTAASFVLINNPFHANFYSNIRVIVEYPVSVYPKAMQIVLTTVIPMAFISFYPVQNLTGKSDFGIFPPVIQYLTLPVGLAFFLISCAIWTLSMRKYKSAGS
jgi:ABC-2 type transport system permease protein